jgi:hypothetical protein
MEVRGFSERNRSAAGATKRLPNAPGAATRTLPTE